MEIYVIEKTSNTRLQNCQHLSLFEFTECTHEDKLIVMLLIVRLHLIVICITLDSRERPPAPQQD